MNPWQQVAQQWRDNPRLRIGGWLILCIVAWYTVSLIEEQRQQLIAQQQASSKRLHKLQNISTQDYWPARARETAAALATLEGQVRRVDSPGLAEADLQGRLARGIKQAGLTKIRTKVAKALPVPDRPGLWRVSARLEGGFVLNPVVQLLAGIESHQNLQWVTAFSVTDTQRPKFALDCDAYYLLPDDVR